MRIKNKIADLQYMFFGCKFVANIEELKYLNTKYCNNFSFMLYKCYQLSDIKALKNGMYQMVIIFHLCSDIVHYQILKH